MSSVSSISILVLVLVSVEIVSVNTSIDTSISCEFICLSNYDGHPTTWQQFQQNDQPNEIKRALCFIWWLIMGNRTINYPSVDYIVIANIHQQLPRWTNIRTGPFVWNNYLVDLSSSWTPWTLTGPSLLAPPRHRVNGVIPGAFLVSQQECKSYIYIYNLSEPTIVQQFTINQSMHLEQQWSHSRIPNQFDGCPSWWSLPSQTSRAQPLKNIAAWYL